MSAGFCRPKEWARLSQVGFTGVQDEGMWVPKGGCVGGGGGAGGIHHHCQMTPFLPTKGTPPDMQENLVARGPHPWARGMIPLLRPAPPPL